ncbi:MAG: 3'(2'),5'-bisphosphate nucleotidase CysQ [Polyangiaceae bacterium]|jgi:3'(2'), 5'-bisphosphate nucleotidase|nr:3'(2'),5'-bisphosphate nucleotidase CysQ [Polyangiaceae bacterium]
MVNETNALLSALIPLARRAGQLILEVYATDFQVHDKGGNDPVTVADRRVNALLCEELARLAPGVPIVAEESAETDYDGYPSAPEAFFVDPLDGTREFVARNGEFVVMIGFARHGKATAGVILAPTTGLLWAGGEGAPAFELAADDARRPLQVSAVSSMTQARVVVSRSRRAPELQSFLDRHPPAELRPLGSAGLKGVAVARDQADLYLQLGGAGCLWDTCAPDAIVHAAGGRYSHPHGGSIDYRGALEIEDGVVGASAGLHGRVIEALGAAR